MTHHQFGSVAGDADMGGTFDATSAILCHEHSTVAVDTIQAGEALPVIALELAGRINKSKDTVQTVWLLSVMDAGQIAGALWNAAERIGTEEAMTDFKVGMSEGAK